MIIGTYDHAHMLAGSHKKYFSEETVIKGKAKGASS